jgi:hypothetical protein
MLHKFAPFALAGLVASVAAQELPAQFEHDRIFLSVKAPDQATVRFFTDSGGGWNAIGQAAAARLRLRAVGQVEVDEAGKKADVVDFPDAMARAGIPPPLRERWLEGRLAVVPEQELHGNDGFLGSRWFAGGIWQIDYPRQSFSALKQAAPTAEDRSTSLGFRVDDEGKRDLHFPRVPITIDGQQLDVLLDTGATAGLGEGAAAKFQLKPGTPIGASFITKSIFEAWRAKHPDWRVIEDGDSLKGRTYPMIEVPQVSMAGVTFGPVWFTQRPDANFEDGMSEMMDKPIVGAIGGSGLKYLRVVLDYPAAKVYVHKPR